MNELILLENADQWEEAINYAAKRIKENPEGIYLLVQKEAVTRCIRCEPQLFKILHQFILDGGKAYVCLKSLNEHRIPSSRPPEIFTRIEDGEKLINDLKQKGFVIKKF